MSSKAAADDVKDRIKIRRARHEDYESVMDINRSVYNGFDYLPDTYHISLHDSNHYAYVNEVNGRVISFLIFEVLDSGTIALLSADRVHPEFQGRGLGCHKNLALLEAFKRDCPTVRQQMYVATFGRHSERTINDSQVINRWRFICYKMAVETRRIVETRLASELVSGGDTRFWSYNESLRLLVKSKVIETFLSSYVHQFITMGNDWTPKPLNEEGLREILLKTNVCMTYDDREESKQLGNPGKEFSLETGVSDEKINKDRIDNDRKLKAFSYSTILKPIEQNVVIIFLYTSDVQLLLKHVRLHLIHAFKITDGRVGMIIHFPREFDHARVVQQLNEGLGVTPVEDWWPNDISCSEIVMGFKQK